jgi:hypothetical protein
MKKFLLVLLLFSPLFSQGQLWKKYRREILLGAGSTSFFGDLGGANQIGSHFVKDLDFSTTRPVFVAGYRYKLNQNNSLRGNLSVGLLTGADKLTQEVFRHNRNLSFRTPIVEFGAIYEVYINKEKVGHRYNIKSAHGFKRFRFAFYAFTGVTGFWFNPQAKFNGHWTNLQPLGTEGQGLPGERRKYSRVSVGVPLGLGVKHSISKFMSIGFEIGVRYTLTDYLDDVSRNYYDSDKIYRANGANGAAAEYLSDPSKGDNPTWTNPGEQRGSPKYKDAYVFTTINISKKLGKHRKRRAVASF